MKWEDKYEEDEENDEWKTMSGKIKCEIDKIWTAQKERGKRMKQKK